MSDKRKLRSRKVSERMAVVDEADRRRVRLPPPTPPSAAGRGCQLHFQRVPLLLLRLSDPGTLCACQRSTPSPAHLPGLPLWGASLVLVLALSGSLRPHPLPPLQVIQARLAALEQDNHKEDDFGAGSDDEYEVPAASGSGQMPAADGLGIGARRGRDGWEQWAMMSTEPEGWCGAMWRVRCGECSLDVRAVRANEPHNRFDSGADAEEGHTSGRKKKKVKVRVIVLLVNALGC